MSDTFNDEYLTYTQMTHEREARDSARRRAIEKERKARQKGREGDSRVTGHYIDYAIEPVLNALDQWMYETENSTKAGRPSNGSRLLPIFKAMTQLDRSEYVATSLSSMFNGISRGVDYTTCAKEIGNRAENILMLRDVRRNEDKLYSKLQKAMKNKSEERKRVDALKFRAKVEGYDYKRWHDGVKANLGAHTIEIILAVTNYFHIENYRGKGGKTSKRILMTPQMAQDYNESTCKFVASSVLREPMVCKPNPWQHGEYHGGGYLSSYQEPLSIAKVSSKSHRKMLRKADMPLVVKALNEAQETPWRIRKPILDVLMHQVEMKNDLGVITRMTEYPIPPDLPTHVAERGKSIYEGYTHDVHISDWLKTLTPRDKDIVQSYLDNRSRKAAVYKQNIELQGGWVTVTRTLASAQKLKDYTAIYFPYQLDFRGRVYAVTQGGLSPQGEDYIKGLLEFSEGKELGIHGYEWLVFHTANVWGDDKLPVEERKKWDKDKLDWLFAMADDPFTNTDWTDADKPYQFLACCIELAEANRMADRTKFHSRMPIALDGSCSGLQHLGMASRCPDTARAVNLLDGDKPSDIYQLVGDKAHANLILVAEGTYPDMPEDETKAEAWRVAAKRWLSWDYALKNGKLNRKIPKRSVMTYPYGSAEFGFRQQLLEDHLDPEAAEWERKNRSYDFPFPDYKDRSDAAGLMAHLLYRGVTATVKLPAELMEWMQKVSALIAKSAELRFLDDELAIGLGLQQGYSDAGACWESPIGFPVYQAYVKPREKLIDSVLYGKRRVQMTLQTSPDSKKRPQLVEKHKQKNGISPNVVHSLDATHLMLTTSALMRQTGVDGKQINAIALIHDSFGTHAANTGILWDTVRETMANMYRRDVFEDLMQQFTSQVHHSLRNDIPELPQYGSFDIDQIKTATYAFA